jgi:organic radical activating enzyme
MTDRIVIPKLEFYITNVCNLTCSGCNRYNNYKFSGWWSWDDAKPVLEQWAKKINIKHKVILGGEPLLNPDIVKWVTGLNTIWPDGGIQVQSNGTRIDMVPDLYESLIGRTWIGVCLHSQDHKEAIFQRIKNFLKEPIAITDEFDKDIGSQWQFKDANNKLVQVFVSDHFVQSNVIELANGKFGLYNSDPVKAHENCSFRKYKNYHMIRGKIYKCGPVALMPEFDDQYGFDISDQDRQLMKSYQGLSADEFDARGQEFLRNIDNVIPQCKFCPESYNYKPITFSNLKPNKI